jgi:hypothetical protein
MIMQNKFKDFQFIAFVLVFALFFTSCKDKEAPVITLQTPTDNQVFHSGDYIKIKGTLTDKELHEMSMVITVNGSSQQVFTRTPTVHDLKSYDINDSAMFVVSQPVSYLLTVTASDHQDHTTVKTVHFTVQ